MKTKILSSTQLDEAVALLKCGNVVAVPTETVYGLAADAGNNAAIKKIYVAKNRPLDHPLIVHVESIDKLSEWADNIPLSAIDLATQFWPGPLTMILQKKSGVSNLITAGLDTVAIRVPNHLLTLEIIRKLGNAIVAPSANAHQKTSPTKPEHVLKTLANKIAAIVDGGACSIGMESTIIDMTQKIPVILRPGFITPEMVQNAVNIAVKLPAAHTKKVSGNMLIHYQPEKPLFLMTLDQINDVAQTQRNIAIIHYSSLKKCENISYYQLSDEKAKYAKYLYDTLHAIDKTSVDKIWVENPPATDVWADVNDRLRKAAAK